MEFSHGILRGLGSLKEGTVSHLVCSIDPQEFAFLPDGIKLLKELQLELEVQSLGQEFVIAVKSLSVEVQGPCSTCGHQRKQLLSSEPEHLPYEKEEIRSGEIDLRGYLKDIFISLVPDSLPCTDAPCEWREDVDRYIKKSSLQKSAKPFNPFRFLLSEKKLKKSQE